MSENTDYTNFSQDEKDYAQKAFGGIDAFIKNYGIYTPDGTPRFGKAYSFLVHPDELTPCDRHFHDQEVARGEVISIQTGEPYNPDAQKEKKGFLKTLFGL